MENKLVVNKAFMSKTSCFKVQLTETKKIVMKNNIRTTKTIKECYMHTGKKEGEKWNWEKAKFNDEELGKLMTFLSNKEKTVSFYHSFGENKGNQIYFNRGSYKGQVVVSPVINKLTGKPLSIGEQVVFKVLLQNIIIQKNLE